jgi:hypothetical protein
MSEKQPVISVDAKKRELTGNFANNGLEWHPKGDVPDVNAYDFLTEATGVDCRINHSNQANHSVDN